jgi:hypothetical protein
MRTFVLCGSCSRIVCWVISCLLLFHATSALAQFRTVTVQNAPSNPVPITVQNTANVNATITGTPAVTVTGTPAVTVGNAANQPVPTAAQGTTTVAGSVTVGNLVGAPVPVRTNDDPGRHPFQKRVLMVLNSGSLFASGFFTTPAGSELVIEDVSFEPASLPVGQNMLYLEVTPSTGGLGANYTFPMQKVADNLGNPNFFMNQALRLYADGSTNVFLYVLRDATGGSTQNVFVNVSGYTVAP